MELQTIDVYILFTLKEKNSLTLREVSNFLYCDQSIAFKSLKRLEDHNLILIDNGRPKKYYINKTKFQKWNKTK